jgi:hypothetical protein
MKIVSLALAFILISASAIAKPQTTSSDVCELEYSNSGFHLYKGGKVFSSNIPNLNRALAMQDGLVANSICTPKSSICNLKYDQKLPGHYYIYKDKKVFSGEFPNLASAEDVIHSLTDHDVCDTPDENYTPENYTR